MKTFNRLDLYIADLSGSLHQVSPHTNPDTRPMHRRPCLGNENPHGGSTSQRDRNALRQGLSGLIQKLWMDHEDSFPCRIITSVKKVASYVLKGNITAAF